MHSLQRLCGILLAATLPALLCAQNKTEDRYVRLMSAQSVSMIEEGGKTLRKAEGPARFLHNDTWLICDTALWDVDTQIIYALGNVSIEQENTELRSDKLTYYIDKDLAEFRGSMVELVDKDMNTLRTRNLDYNTKDSVAVFRSGASMRDKDGQIIESLDGTYESKLSLFTFESEVNMFSDSVFVKTTKLFYNSKSSVATFPNYVDAWNEDRMLSGGNGYYNNDSETFFFTGDVHTMNPTQEGWCDSLYYFRKDGLLELMGNAQLSDTSRATTGLADFIRYRDSLSFVTMYKDPLIISEFDDKDSNGVAIKDTAYVRADTLKYWKVMKFRLDSIEVATAQARLKELADDPVANIRAKAAEEAERLRREAEENDPNTPPDKRGKKPGDGDKGAESGEDGNVPAQNVNVPPQNGSDSLGLNVADSTMLAGVDSLAVLDKLLAEEATGPVYTAEDSVEFAFLHGNGSVKIFRKNMQVICDSLVYTDIDSLARLYNTPIVWNSPTHQYNADSIFVAIQDNRMQRANLISNAFIHIEETPKRFYDQIKGTEMIAFFGEDSEMTRFDALGGINALFYMKEKGEVSMANKSESTMMSANFTDGELSTLSYYESPTSNAYPVPQLSSEDKFLKGFNWTPDKRPTSVKDLSLRKARASQKEEYESHPRAEFKQTDIYFPGYMKDIYRKIAVSDSLKQVRAEKERELEREQGSKENGGGKLGLDKLDKKLSFADSLGLADSLGTLSGSLGLGDSLSLGAHADSLALADSLGGLRGGSVDSLAVKDSLGTISDSLSIKTAAQLKAEAKEAKKAERQAKKQAALEKREVRWDALDAKAALKQAAKDAKKREKREKKLKAEIARLEKEKAREDALLARYKEKYMKKNLRTE